MNGFNVGVLVSLGDMELALDYLNDEEVFEPEITEYQKDRQQKNERSVSGLSSEVSNKYGLDILEHDDSSEESRLQDNQGDEQIGFDDSSGDEYAEEEISEWDSTTPDEFDTSDLDEFDITDDSSDEFDTSDSDEFDITDDDSDEFDITDDGSDEFEASDSDKDSGSDDNKFDTPDNKFENGNEYQNNNGSEDAGNSLSEDYSNSTKNDDSELLEDEGKSEYELELERELAEAQKKLQKAKERRAKAISERKAREAELKKKLAETLRQLDELNQQDESDHLENEISHDNVTEHIYRPREDKRNIKEKGLGQSGQHVRAEHSTTEQERNAKARIGGQPNTGQLTHTKNNKSEHQAVRNTVQKSVQSNPVKADTERITQRAPKSVRKQSEQTPKLSKEQVYGEMDTDALYSKVVEFMMTHGISKSAIDKNILDSEFGVSNINKLIMKSYLISMGKKVTIGK